jgi:hypothetical protein
MRALKTLSFLLALALVSAACGTDGPDEAEEPAAAEPTEAPEADEEGPDEGEPWPSPLTIYIPAAPGGGFDIAVRAMQPYIADSIGNDVIPENIEGAGGAVAAEQMLSEPADGT